MFQNIKVGDWVIEAARNEPGPKKNAFPRRVSAVTAKRFVVDLGINEYTGSMMKSHHRRLDGRSVGNAHHVTFMLPYPMVRV